jgi:5-methylcytosine-specific restriction endonuclease McrA
MGFVDALRGMSDAELLGSLDRVVGRGRRITAEVLAHLGEVEARRLYLDAACSSLFAYCTERLRLDAGAAYKRILAARAARRFPMILQMVSDGGLHLAGIGLLAPHLTPANHEELLAAATNKSKREIEALLADRAPKPPVPSRIRKLPEPSRPPDRAATLDLGGHPIGGGERAEMGARGTAQRLGAALPSAVPGAGTGAPAVGEDVHASVIDQCTSSQSATAHPATSAAVAPSSVAPSFFAPPSVSSPSASSPPDAPASVRTQQSSALPQPPRPEPAAPRTRGVVAPLGHRRHRVEFTASDALVGRLERARALLSHRLPGSDIADVIDQALTELVERLEKERFGVRGSGKARGRAKASSEARRRATIRGCGAGTDRPRVPDEAANEDHASRLDQNPVAPGDSESERDRNAARGVCTTAPGHSAGGEANEPRRDAGSATAPGRSSGALLGQRRVPMAVRRAVYERDGARCTHVDAEGRRCNATHHLQLDHIVPWARGGASNVSNIRLLCRQHNLLAARRSFGPAFIDRRIELARGGGR